MIGRCDASEEAFRESSVVHRKGVANGYFVLREHVRRIREFAFSATNSSGSKGMTVDSRNDVRMSSQYNYAN